jgi:hypothetical protein
MFCHVDGFIQCCACHLGPEELIEPNEFVQSLGITEPFYMWPNKNFDSVKEALEHLREHKKAGHMVPRYAIAELIDEIEALAKEGE